MNGAARPGKSADGSAAGNTTCGKAVPACPRPGKHFSNMSIEVLAATRYCRCRHSMKLILVNFIHIFSC